MLKLGWFSTGRGFGSRNFLNQIQAEIVGGQLDAKIEFVFSNREFGEEEGSDQFLNLVKSYNLPLLTLSSRRFRQKNGRGPMEKHRSAFHSEVMNQVSKFSPDICVLAGYMLIISKEMCRKLNTINLHPSLPKGPVGTWKEVIWDLIGHKAEHSGVMAHVVTEKLDEGPVLAYCSYPISGPGFDTLWQEVCGRPAAELIAEGEGQPLFNAIRREGLRREGPLLISALQELSEGRRQVFDGQVLDVHGAPVPGICLNEAIDRLLGQQS